MDTEVLVVGGGPVGLTAAHELRRRAVDVIVLDRRQEPAPFAKAVGIQPRTVELWDCAGIARDALDAAATLRGAIVYVNGEQVSRIELRLPDEVPYRFLALPQYETERVLAEALSTFGTHVQRGVELVGFDQDDDGVTATVRDLEGERTITARYLVGCDGAHSLVRTRLGLSFEGGAVADEFMLADVELDWDLPTGYSIRATRRAGDGPDDLLVCIPLPGRGRYRVSMLAPAELSTGDGPADRVQHGLEGGRAPQLQHVQAVLDRLAPQPHDRVPPAVVVGVPDQPPPGGPVRRRPGLRGGRCRAHPSTHGRAGHEHGHPGRVQPRLEARAGGARRGRRGPAGQLPRRTAPGR